MNIMEPKAAGIKTKHGDLVVDVGQIMRNLNGVEQEDGKKSILQKLLEPKDVDDSEKDMKKAQRIAKKNCQRGTCDASGETISEASGP